MIQRLLGRLLPEPELIPVRLDVKPGDTVALTHPGTLDKASVDRIRATFQNVYPGVRAVIFEEGMRPTGVLRYGRVEVELETGR